jgi:hypothetical protein
MQQEGNMTEDTRQEVETEEFDDGIFDEALGRTPLAQGCEYSRRGP